MKVLSRTADGLKRCYNVSISPEEIAQENESKLREIAKEIKMDGFRPGKVPVDGARRLYGDRIEAEAKNTVIDNSAKKVLADEKLAISFGYATDIVKEDKDGIEFTLKFELIPSFELYDFSKIDITKHVVDVTEKDSLEILENIRKASTNWKKDAKAKKVEEGQKVVIDLTMLTKLKKHKEDKIEDLDIIIGDKSLVDDFWKHLVGAKVGDTVEFDISYPSDFGDKILAGKKIHYSALIK